jgi:hypothetical protein
MLDDTPLRRLEQTYAFFAFVCGIRHLALITLWMFIIVVAMFRTAEEAKQRTR